MMELSQLKPILNRHLADCGGTLRNESHCRLHPWFSDDAEHRLTAEKPVKILEKVQIILGTDHLDPDIENQGGYISQFSLQSVEASPNKIIPRLTERHTACLAEDRFKPKQPDRFNPLTSNPRTEPSACCGNNNKTCHE